MNELIIIEKQDVMAVFTQRDLITPLLAKVEHFAMLEPQDVTTEKGRKEIASIAYRVAQSKTYIEAQGKDLAAELKELPKLVDSNRKYARDFLDDLKDRIRKPLDDWEANQAAMVLADKVLLDHEIALLDNIQWVINQKETTDRIAKERADYEAKVLADAEIKAKIVADEKATRKIIDAEARALSAERENIRIQEQAKRDIETANQRAIQEAKRSQDETIRLQEQSKRDIAQATQRAIQEAKLFQEKEERIKQAQERVKEQAKANRANIDEVHKSVIDDLLAVGLNEKQCKYLLVAIFAKKIRALKIEY